MSQTLGLGIDVSKHTLVYATSDRALRGTVDRSPAGLARLLTRLAGRPITCALVEATGGYELLVLETLYAAGLPIARIPAARARHGARALGYDAKTDALDAQTLAELAASGLGKTRPWRPFPPAIVALRAMIDRIDTLQRLRDGERKRLELAHPAIHASLQGMISALDAQLHDAEHQARLLVAADSALQTRVTRLTSTPGVGWKTALRLLAVLPELGQANRRQIAALAGLAPRNRQSGGQDGRRFTQGGRPGARHALFMATLSALVHNPTIRAVYARIRARGAPAMVAVVACMRRLLVWLNGLDRACTRVLAAA